MPGQRAMPAGQLARVLGAADDHPLAKGFVTGQRQEAGERFKMAGARCGGKFDLHRLQLAADRNQQIHFQPVMRSPEMEFGLAAKRHEGLHCLCDHPTFEERASERTRRRGIGIRLPGEQIPRSRSSGIPGHVPPE